MTWGVLTTRSPTKTLLFSISIHIFKQKSSNTATNSSLDAHSRRASNYETRDTAYSLDGYSYEKGSDFLSLIMYSWEVSDGRRWTAKRQEAGIKRCRENMLIRALKLGSSKTLKCEISYIYTVLRSHIVVYAMRGVFLRMQIERKSKSTTRARPMYPCVCSALKCRCKFFRLLWEYLNGYFEYRRRIHVPTYEMRSWLPLLPHTRIPESRIPKAKQRRRWAEIVKLALELE